MSVLSFFVILSGVEGQKKDAATIVNANETITYLISIYKTRAKLETFRLLYFRLGYCGSDEEVKALKIEAIGAAES